MTAMLSSRSKVLYSKQKSIHGELARLLILSFINFFCAINNNEKSVYGGRGGKSKTYRNIKQKRLIISMTIFSERNVLD